MDSGTTTRQLVLSVAVLIIAGFVAWYSSYGIDRKIELATAENVRDETHGTAHIYRVVLRAVLTTADKTAIAGLEVDRNGTVTWVNQVAIDRLGINQGDDLHEVFSGMPDDFVETHKMKFAEAMRTEQPALRRISCKVFDNATKRLSRVTVETWTTKKGAMGLVAFPKSAEVGNGPEIATK